MTKPQVSAETIALIRTMSGLCTAVDLLQIARRAEQIAQEQDAATLEPEHVQQALAEFGKEDA